MLRRNRPPADPIWTYRDACLWRTCEVLLAIARDEVHLIPPVPTIFPPQGGVNEAMLLTSPFELLEVRAPGDGTYVHNNGVAVATGRGAFTFMAAFYAAQSLGNRSRRNRAAALAVPRLMPTDGGSITVSTHGFYLQSQAGLFFWAWQGIDQADIAVVRDFLMSGESTNGPVTWIVRSDAAEMIFCLWALARHPNHPRWVHQRWLPEGWVEWARSQRGPVPFAGPAQLGR